MERSTSHRSLERRTCAFSPKPQTFSPSEDWLLAFQTQYQAPGAVERLHDFARQRARIIATTGRTVDDYFVRELVQDVLGDTIMGLIVWDPNRIPLEKHVIDAIRSRVRHQYVRGKKSKMRRLDELSSREHAELEQVLLDHSQIAAERQRAGAHASETIQALRAVTRDDEVLLLLDAIENDITVRAELLTYTGLTAAQLRAARKRMRTLLNRLPAHLRQRGVL
jgi:hypothetical protein